MKQKLKLLKSKSYIKLILFVFFCASSSALFQPYQSIFLKEVVRASPEQIGFFISLNSIAGIIYSTSFAKISDRKKCRKSILGLAIICAIIGYLFYGHVNNFSTLLIISLTFIGISTMITAQMFAFAKDELKNRVSETEPYITLLRMIVSLAWVISPLTAPILLTAFDFKGIIGGTIAGYIIALLILHFFKTSENCENKIFIDKENKKKPYFYIIINFIVFTILESMNVIANTNMPLYITNILGYGKKYVGYLTAFSALIEVPCMVILATLAIKKVNHKFIIGCGIISGCMFFLLAGSCSNIRIIIFVYIFKSIFNAVYKGIGIAFFQKMIPENCGISTTLFTNTTRVGAIVGGGIVGSYGSYKENFFAIAIIFGIFSLILYFVGESVSEHKFAKKNIQGGEL